MLSSKHFFIKLRIVDINRNQRKSNRFVSAKDTKNCGYDYKMVQKVSNEEVYGIIQVKPWMQTIKIFQTKWLGHLTKLPTR